MFTAPKSAAYVYVFAWGFRNLECWIIRDKPVNKNFCICPALPVQNQSVLGRQSPLEGSSALCPASPFTSPGEAGGHLSHILSQTPQRERQQWHLPNQHCVQELHREGTRKDEEGLVLCNTWWAVRPDALSEGGTAAAENPFPLIEYDQKQNFPIPASSLELTLQCPRMLLQSRDDSQRKEPPSLLPGQVQHCGRNGTSVPVLLPTEVGHYSRRNVQQFLH